MRFNPLADDPLTIPPAAPVTQPDSTPTKPRRARKATPKADAIQPIQPAAPTSPIAAALAKVPDPTLLFLAKDSPLAGLPAEEVRQRTLAHAATFNGPHDWRRVFASLLASAASVPLQAAADPKSEPVEPLPQPSPMSLVQAWRSRLHGFTAQRFA